MVNYSNDTKNPKEMTSMQKTAEKNRELLWKKKMARPPAAPFTLYNTRIKPV
jgi:hypothetical protein